MPAKIEIYTKNYCPYCTKAKTLLTQLGVKYDEIDISLAPEKMDELQARRPGSRTVPQIFINGKGIGGCDDLYALHQQGKLEALLA